MWKSFVIPVRYLRMAKKAGGFYAIHSGRRTGVVYSWAECEKLVKGFAGAKFKKFATLEEAQNFVRGDFSSSKYGAVRAPPSGSTLGVSSRLATRRAAEPNENDKCQASSAPKRKKLAEDETDNKLEMPVVYTDGACSGNGTLSAKAGIGVYWGDGDPRNVSEPLEGRPTNNRAEIQAAARAIQQAKDQGFKSVEIRTDSNFLVESVTKWIPGWQKKNWVSASGKAVVNKEDFVDLLEACEGIEVVWTHVRGHVGIHGNEQADSLAVQGMLKKRIDN